LGFPAGCPRRFFCATRDFFSAAVISPEVLGVLLETRLLGLQYGVPRFSPSLRPQALPVRTSFQSSLNHRFRALPFSVLRTATGFLLPAFGYSARGVRRREDFVRCLHLAVTIIFDRTAFLKRNGLHFAHASTLHHGLYHLTLSATALGEVRRSSWLTHHSRPSFRQHHSLSCSPWRNHILPPPCSHYHPLPCRP
jgi:hypothetical protein